MKTWLLLAAVNGFIAVAAGAFATHGLDRSGLADAARLFEIAARYQIIHAVALLSIAWLMTLDAARGKSGVRIAGWLFGVGILLFSGSLYALALSPVRAFAFVTPLGGLALLGGWAALALTALKLK